MKRIGWQDDVENVEREVISALTFNSSFMCWHRFPSPTLRGVLASSGLPRRASGLRHSVYDDNDSEYPLTQYSNKYINTRVIWVRVQVDRSIHARICYDDVVTVTMLTIIVLIIVLYRWWWWWWRRVQFHGEGDDDKVAMTLNVR